MPQDQPSIAIVHDYFNQFGGAEKVVEELLRMYPTAHIYSTIFIPENFISSPELSAAWQEKRVHTTWLQYIFQFTFARKFFKHFFWMYPVAMSMVTVANYDTVFISSTYCGKNIKVKNVHKLIHYCHSPVRFLHGLVTETDHKSLGKLTQKIIPLFTFWLKWMDLRAVSYLNNHGCIWLANSVFIQQTIKDVYQTDSQVIYPPIETSKFLAIARGVPSDFYLCHGRISFHKRIDLAIEACLRLKKRLYISGTSGLPKEMDVLQAIVSHYEQDHEDAKGLITFLGRTLDEQLANLVSQAKAFLFPGKEDFGIAPIEMLAAGVPVIAYEAGGALEYIKDGVNGVFFDQQSIASLTESITRFESLRLDETAIRQSSKAFDQSAFQEAIKKVIN